MSHAHFRVTRHAAKVEVRIFLSKGRDDDVHAVAELIEERVALPKGFDPEGRVRVKQTKACRRAPEKGVLKARRGEDVKLPLWAHDALPNVGERFLCDVEKRRDRAKRPPSVFREHERLPRSVEKPKSEGRLELRDPAAHDGGILVEGLRGASKAPKPGHPNEKLPGVEIFQNGIRHDVPSLATLTEAAERTPSRRSSSFHDAGKKKTQTSPLRGTASTDRSKRSGPGSFLSGNSPTSRFSWVRFSKSENSLAVNQLMSENA